MQSKKKMSFVMPAYKASATIGRAIESLLDQDYKNYEIIVSLDGFEDKEEINNICKAISNKNPIAKEQIDGVGRLRTVGWRSHRGACAARNAGAELATGDYISFFSSDFIAEPGMLRRWMQVFEETDADFVYGGYKFWDVQGQALYSEPFDLYSLTCYPYIDGGFPVKMSVFREHPWDENCKSLNDWEWTLRIALSGAKFVYIPDFSYAAQSPQQGGLSHDSHSNWTERVGYIKKKLGIPERDICICSAQYRADAKRLAQHIGADYMPMPSFRPHNYKLIYQIGFDYDNATYCAQMFNNAPKTKKVIHWMPMDVRKIKTKANVASIERLAQAMTAEGFMNYACTNEDVKFLVNFGFTAKLGYYFACADGHVNGAKQPIVWLQPGLEELKKGMPDIQVTTNRHASNVDVLVDPPWGPVAESLLAGKKVITNIPYPNVTMMDTKPTYPEQRSEIINLVRANKHKKGMGIESLCNERKFKKEIQRLCQK